jgi:hypothetical protein
MPAVPTQLTTVNRLELVEQAWAADSAAMRKVDEGVRIALGAWFLPHSRSGGDCDQLELVARGGSRASQATARRARTNTLQHP